MEQYYTLMAEIGKKSVDSKGVNYRIKKAI